MNIISYRDENEARPPKYRFGQMFLATTKHGSNFVVMLCQIDEEITGKLISLADGNRFTDDTQCLNWYDGVELSVLESVFSVKLKPINTPVTLTRDLTA